MKMQMILRRRGVAAAVCALAVCVIVAIVWGVGASRRSSSAANESAAAQSTASALERADASAGNQYPPCGDKTQQILSLADAQRKLGSKLLLPSDENASNSTVKAVALCSDTFLIVEYDNGVWIYEQPYYGEKPDPSKAAANDPNESKVGTVNGQAVHVITPAQGEFPRRGAVYLYFDNGRQVIVVGNTTLSVDEMESIAASIQPVA